MDIKYTIEWFQIEENAFSFFKSTPSILFETIDDLK